MGRKLAVVMACVLVLVFGLHYGRVLQQVHAQSDQEKLNDLMTQLHHLNQQVHDDNIKLDLCKKLSDNPKDPIVTKCVQKAMGWNDTELAAVMNMSR